MENKEKYIDRPRYKVIEKYEEDFTNSYSALLRVALKEIKIKLDDGHDNSRDTKS